MKFKIDYAGDTRSWFARIVKALLLVSLGAALGFWLAAQSPNICICRLIPPTLKT